MLLVEMMLINFYKKNQKNKYPNQFSMKISSKLKLKETS